MFLVENLSVYRVLLLFYDIEQYTFVLLTDSKNNTEEV